MAVYCQQMALSTTGKIENVVTGANHRKKDASMLLCMTNVALILDCLFLILGVSQVTVGERL